MLPNECMHDITKAHRVISGDTNTYYYAWKQFGNGNEADAIWAIAKKWRPSAAAAWKLQWADGNENYDNILNNYASLTYSDLS